MKTNTTAKPCFELVYKNGKNMADVKPPEVRDIALSKESIALIDEVITESELLPKRITNEGEKVLYVEIVTKLRTLIKEIEICRDENRAPWKRVIALIDSAFAGLSNKLAFISSAVAAEIAQWEQIVRDGQLKLKADLERKAYEKKQEAEYSDDADKKRIALNQSRLFREEAKKAVINNTSNGIGLHNEWEAEIQDIGVLIKKYPEFVDVSLRDHVIKKAIRDLKEQGVEITSRSFAPALYLRKVARVSFRG